MERTSERKQFLSDIIITAVEAGWPWFLIEQYQWAEYDGGADSNVVHVYTGEPVTEDRNTRATVRELADTEDTYKDEQLTLDFDAVERGLSLIIGDTDQRMVSGRVRKEVIAASATNDAGDIDADLADCIVQAGLLGEIVYG